MNLYLISQTANTGYDTYDSAVVCAANPHDAQHTHPDKRSVWNADASFDWCSDWALPSLVKVTLIGTALPDAKPGVICASYNAG